MPLNHDFLGRSYGPSEPYEVSREKIREFAEAIGESSPASTDPDAARALGHDDVVAPPTFATVLTFRARTPDHPFADPALGLDYSRLVHGEQHFRYARPLRPGDRLVSTLTITGMKDVGRNEVMTLTSETRTVEGELVVTADQTVVIIGTAAGDR